MPMPPSREERALLRRAKEIAAAGDRDAGVRLVEGMIAERPDSFDAWFVLARIQLGAGDPAAAKRAICRALVLSPHEKAVALDEAITQALDDVWAASRGLIGAARATERSDAPPDAKLDAWIAAAGEGADAAAWRTLGARDVRAVREAAIVRQPEIALPAGFPDLPPDWSAAEDLALVRALHRQRDFRRLNALAAAAKTSHGAWRVALADHVGAILGYHHQCFHDAAAAAARFLAARLDPGALPETDRDLLRFETETIRARSLQTIGRASEIALSGDLPGPKPSSRLRRALDLHWRGDPARGLALARALLFTAKPPPRASVLACWLPLVLGDPQAARRSFAALVARARASSARIPAELVLCGARIALECGDPQAQAALASLYLRSHRLDPPALTEAGALTFETIRNDRAAAAPPGPLVSIVMTAFNAAATIATALGSLTVQSHADLEILVVDDCSTDGTRDLIARIAQADPRIRVLHNDANIGTYASKNRALADARGRYYTVQDADDWSHPRRIERHVAAMEADPMLVATASDWFRMDPDGRPVIRPSTGIFRHRNPGSAFVRLDAFRSHLGGYDRVRIDADNDHWLRLLAAFGAARIVRLPLPLAIGRMTETSLTRSGVGVQDDELYSPVRSEYRRAGMLWRAQRGPDALRYDPDGPRPFPAPAEMLV